MPGANVEGSYYQNEYVQNESARQAHQRYGHEYINPLLHLSTNMSLSILAMSSTFILHCC